ncbi:hypothetical protein B0F90DRAFT_1632930 [Multifurca ochricompacta]|uniref:YCII-related domain-containing protein n=1 Tax=Multifurca ochricompacta TaxID=376703 RepID=A0AAD4M197_9AGAM|nr:hypothetical protein B0F90DRAFT_1632930 [Multifurca ochricompacta]
MATTSTPNTKHTFAVWAPDYTDPEAAQRRLAIRAEHLEGIKRLVGEGFIKYGGPVADPESKILNGSLLVVEAESAAAARAVLEKDPYWANNVWDKENLEVRSIDVGVNVR